MDPIERSTGTLLSTALRYAAAGCKILPLHTIAESGLCSCGKRDCASPGKHPRVKNGAYEASGDSALIRKWLERWPDCNLGMTLAGLVVIDIDPRHSGEATFENLIAQNGAVADTWHQRSGGGGDHYVFRADDSARYGGALGAGVDLKHGAGQFIVVEPSLHASGNRYCWLDESGPFEGGKLADAPRWLTSALVAKDLPKPDAGKIGAGQRNHFLYERARRLRDLSFNQGEIMAAVMALNARCDPPLSADECFTIAKSAAQNDPELETPSAVFVEAQEFVSKIDPPTWLVDSVIQRGYLYSMTAQTNHGKTAIATVLSLCVARGQRFGGLDTQRGEVLYLCGENPEDFKIRLRGAMAALQLDAKDVSPYLWIMPVTDRLTNLLDPISKFCSDHPALSLVVIDTSVAYFSYEDENDNIAAKQHAQDMRSIVSMMGHPAVIGLSHPIKNATRDCLVPRGGSAFLNEVDCNLTVWKEGDALELGHTKVRGPGFQTLAFQLETTEVPGVVDSKGNPISTVVARHISDDESVRLHRDKTADEDQLLSAMKYEPEGSVADWARYCGWTVGIGAPHKSKVYRLLTSLKADQLVKHYRGTWALTQKGRDVADGGK